MDFFGQLVLDEFVGLPGEALPFGGGEEGDVDDIDPFVAGEVGGWPEAGTGDEFVEFFVGAFEGDGDGVLIGTGDDKHLAADTETEVFFPLDVFGDAGECGAEGAEGFEVHVAI